MRLLLDTHVFLWYVSADSQLPIDIRDAIRDPNNEVHLGSASVWEAVIKHGVGKLPLPGPPATYLRAEREAHRIASLAVDEDAFPYLSALPPLHRDPFDRMIIAQALQHALDLVSFDGAVRAYAVPVLPAR
jgi:PIN domain nuclease of toxin-antitoxin system